MSTINKEALSKEIDSTFTAHIDLLDSFSNEQFNRIPFEGSWTAGQLSQHVVLVAKGYVQLMTGPAVPAARNPEEHVDNIRKAFLDYTHKMTSPDFVAPEIKAYDKTVQIKGLKDIKEQALMAFASADLSLLCMAFAFPVLGHLTGIEATNFVLCHTQRHIHQLHNIFNKIN